MIIAVSSRFVQRSSRADDDGFPKTNEQLARLRASGQEASADDQQRTRQARCGCPTRLRALRRGTAAFDERTKLRHARSGENHETEEISIMTKLGSGPQFRP